MDKHPVWFTLALGSLVLAGGLGTVGCAGLCDALWLAAGAAAGSCPIGQTPAAVTTAPAEARFQVTLPEVTAGPAATTADKLIANVTSIVIAVAAALFGGGAIVFVKRNGAAKTPTPPPTA